MSSAWGGCTAVVVLPRAPRLEDDDKKAREGPCKFVT